MFSFRFNATFYWNQINIFIVVNKSFVDSIKEYLMFHINWFHWIFFFSVKYLAESVNVQFYSKHSSGYFRLSSFMCEFQFLESIVQLFNIKP